ncbi:hypothetical protein ACO0R3_002563 [Hanseniaspora guilliermondii]
MDIIEAAGQHLELTSIFAIVLIYIKVDVSIESDGLTDDHILSFIFFDERRLTFQEKLTDVFGTFKDSLLMTNIAFPFLINILREPMFFNNLIFTIFILSKDLLPKSKLHSKNVSNDHFSSFHDLIRYEIQKNSIIGKFLHSACLMYTTDPIMQQNFNFTYLENIGNFDEQHVFDSLIEYEKRSMIAKILFSRDNFKAFEQFKTEHLTHRSIQPIYLKDLLPVTHNKLKLSSAIHISLDKEATPVFHNKQDFKDYFFSRLDCCSNHFEVLNLLHTFICHEIYNKDTKFLLEVLTTIIDSGKFDDDHDISSNIFLYLHILLSFKPNLRESELVSKGHFDLIKGYRERIATSIIENYQDLSPNWVSFVLAEAKLEAYEGNFKRAYNVLLMAANLRLRTTPLRPTSSFINHDPISYTQAKKDLFLSMGYGYGVDNYNNPIHQINQYKFDCNDEMFIHSGIIIEDSKTLIKFENNSTDETSIFRRYNHAKLLAKQKLFMEAMNEIDSALEVISSRNFMWIFELKLLKCLIFEKSCNNTAKVMRMYRETFIDNDAYMGNLDLYRKLLVGAYYMLFTQINNVSPNNACRFYYQNNGKVSLFKNTRLIHVWEDIYSNL